MFVARLNDITGDKRFNYVLFDLVNDTSVHIGLNDFNNFDDVTLENNKIIFRNSGDTVVAMVDNFPIEYIYDINTEELELVKTYLEFYQSDIMGYYSVELEMVEIEAIDNYINLNIEMTDNTVFAGGDGMCTTTKTGRNHEGYLYIDFEYMIIGDDVKNSLNLLVEETPFIKDIIITEYKDSIGIMHSVINFKIVDYTLYRCDLILDGYVYDIQIKLK